MSETTRLRAEGREMARKTRLQQMAAKQAQSKQTTLEALVKAIREGSTQTDSPKIATERLCKIALEQQAEIDRLKAQVVQAANDADDATRKASQQFLACDCIRWVKSDTATIGDVRRAIAGRRTSTVGEVCAALEAAGLR